MCARFAAPWPRTELYQCLLCYSDRHVPKRGRSPIRPVTRSYPKARKAGGACALATMPLRLRSWPWLRVCVVRLYRPGDGVIGA